MKSLIKTLTVAIATLATVASMQALPITGGVTFLGSYTANGTAGDLTTATQVTPTITTVVGVGDLSGAVFGSFLSPVGINGSVGSNVGQVLWLVTASGDSYALKVDSSIQTLGIYNQVALQGTGTITRNGLDATGGTWQLGFGETTVFGFQSTTGATVPDGGATAALIGVGILGLGMMRRKA